MAHVWTEIQLKWLAALRSDDFKQGKHFLHGRNGYCCLGVCYRLIHGIDPNPRKAMLTKKDFTQIGLHSGFGSLANANNGYLHLSDMNDQGMTFNQIADYIEAHPENVFIQPGEE